MADVQFVIRPVKNFTEEEKVTLAQLMLSHSSIEEKSNHSRILHRKREAWKSIHKEFSSQFPGRARTIEQLKGCWKRMKLEAKKNLINNQQIIKSADDSASSELSNEPSKRIIEIIQGSIQSIQYPNDQPMVSVPDFEFQYKQANENCQPNNTPVYDVSIPSCEEHSTKQFSQFNVESQSLPNYYAEQQTILPNINKQERRANIKRKMRKAILEELLATEKLKRENERLRKWILTKECEEKGYGLPPPDFN
ncbi:uncharacterized protein LOC111633651 [Centruroides sculpturatus]|uniref:uncharacterized protein LOC111633651 n=1 Tax=Centruroides sculpturatus TaxID=218467 RepID=UPI000C6CF8C2|nr:uncharacterized protein LOC111633651 [Centruroides sculpturatus]